MRLMSQEYRMKETPSVDSSWNATYKNGAYKFSDTHIDVDLNIYQTTLAFSILETFSSTSKTFKYLRMFYNIHCRHIGKVESFSQKFAIYQLAEIRKKFYLNVYVSSINVNNRHLIGIFKSNFWIHEVGFHPNTKYVIG